MSTRCAIIIKVRENDLNKVMKFNADKLPSPLQKWGNNTIKESSENVTITTPYIGIYCHSDGYFSGVGAVLKKVFKDYDSVLNLIIGGDCSFVWYDRVRHYANRKGEKWDWIKPTQGDSIDAVARHIGHNGYVYLFDDGKWSAQNGNEFSDYDGNGIL